ncbi:Hypothetical predicted protein [Octopus vulgaris]|uniref:Uncharacterized protein n=1 Tax=Octopus vulgaris TaxID=6645 RepID=A0AA36ALP4_OCTVU|nr:Hypothetical predicted protein [Octopus vulgaris]
MKVQTFSKNETLNCIQIFQRDITAEAAAVFQLLRHDTINDTIIDIYELKNQNFHNMCVFVVCVYIITFFTFRKFKHIYMSAETKTGVKRRLASSHLTNDLISTLSRFHLLSILYLSLKPLVDRAWKSMVV